MSADGKTITVKIGGAAMKAIARCAVASDVSEEQALADAIGFYDWARAQVEKGGSIAVVDHRNERVREYGLKFDGEHKS